MRRWDIQDGNWHAELGVLAAREKGERNLPQAGREMRRGIYHMTWDFQGRIWQVGRKHVPQEVGTAK